MAKTENVTFPVWGAVEKSVQIDNDSYMALYIGNKLSVDQIGDTYSIITVVSPDIVNTGGLFFALTPSLSGAGVFPLILTSGYILGMGLRSESSDILVETSMDPRLLGLYDSISRAPIDIDTGLIDPVAAGKPLHLCVTMEVLGITSGVVDSVKCNVFINGHHSVVDSNGLSGWDTTAGTPLYMIMQKDMKIGAVRLYDRILTAPEVLQDYRVASDVDFRDYTDVDSVTIEGVPEKEFNGYFGPKQEVSMSSNTTGTFKIPNARVNSSFNIDPSTGLPEAGSANFGAFFTLGSESHSTKYPLDTAYIASPVTDVVTILITWPIDTVVPPISVGTEVFVSGILGGSTGWSSYNGTKTIVTESQAIRTITYTQTWNGREEEVLFRELTSEAKLYLGYPSSFDISAEVPGSNTSPGVLFSNVQNNQKYTVRVRGISTQGAKSPWVQDTVTANVLEGDTGGIGGSTSRPNPVYTTGAVGEQVNIVGVVNFDKDLSGVLDPTFHPEINMSYLEMVVCTANTDRDSAASSPGGDLPNERYTYKTYLPLGGPAVLEGLGRFAAVTGAPPSTGDHFIWMRLVNTSGQVSDWFPNDTGIASERTYPTAGTTIGLGPFRLEVGASENLAEDTASAQTDIDTSTQDPEGPASSGVGGIFTAIP